MRQFASSGFRIWNLSFEAKLIYSFFGLFSLLALGSSALFYEDLVGAGTPGIGPYYAKNPSPGSAPRTRSASPATGPNSGPKLDLPDPAPGDDPAPAVPTQITVAVSYRKLLEVTHFHLFTVPVFLLIVAHLFMLTGLAARTKAIWIAGGWLSALLHLAAPWVVHYGGSGWAWLYAASGGLLGITSGVLTVFPIWSMWVGRPARPSPQPAGEDAEIE